MLDFSLILNNSDFMVGFLSGFIMTIGLVLCILVLTIIKYAPDDKDEGMGEN